MDKPGTDTPGGDVQKPSDTEKPGGSAQGGGQSQTGGDSDKAVQTGDMTNVLPVAAACAAAFAAAGSVAVVKVRRRK